MDSQFWEMLLKIIIFLPFIIALIFLSLKLGGTKLQGARNGRYIKIIERVSLSKDNSLLVVTMGEKGYVISCSNNKIDILSEVTKEEVVKLQVQQGSPTYENINKWIEKLRNKKEEKNE